jgi:predicted O-methyltransferase YrrM
MLRQLLSHRKIRLVGKAVRHPGRAVLRLTLRARLKRKKIKQERARLLRFLSLQFGVNAVDLLHQYRQSEFYQGFQQRRAALDHFRGPYRFGTTGLFGCEALYLLVRASRPKVAVDTGVLYGASTAHILAAMADNGSGELHSIDIGRNPSEPPHEFFIPANLLQRWELIIGDSRDELPRLLRRCGKIDLFYHDSLHTWEHMLFEYGTALPYLTERGVLASDDVENAPSLRRLFRQNAFPAFCHVRGILYTTFHNLGVAMPGLASAASNQPRRRQLVSQLAPVG